MPAWAAEEAPAKPGAEAAKPEAAAHQNQGPSKGDEFYAAEPKAIGHIATLEGKAKAAAPEGKDRQLAANDFVYLNDKIWTGNSSKVQVEFKDGTAIALGAKASMTLDEFVYKPKDPQSRCVASIAKGAFKVIGGAISATAPDQVKVKTPTATIGIRGTVCVGEASKDMTLAIFTEGKAISVTNDLGQSILDGQAGMGCETKRGEAPGKPVLMLDRMNGLMSGIAVQVMRNNHAVNQGIGARAGAVGQVGAGGACPPPSGGGGGACP